MPIFGDHERYGEMGVDPNLSRLARRRFGVGSRVTYRVDRDGRRQLRLERRGHDPVELGGTRAAVEALKSMAAA